MSLSPEKRRRLQELVVEAVEILGEGPQVDGKPMTFSQLEDACIELGDFMTAQMMQQQIVNRRPRDESPCCPTCQQTGEPQSEQEARVLQTDRGEVAWLESMYYCRGCRRSFFPSVA
jgi:hypothetical protein